MSNIQKRKRGGLTQESGVTRVERPLINIPDLCAERLILCNVAQDRRPLASVIGRLWKQGQGDPRGHGVSVSFWSNFAKRKEISRLSIKRHPLIVSASA